MSRLTITLTLILSMAGAAVAQDVVPWPHKQGLKPIQLKSHSMNVTITDQVAEVTIEPTFHNPNGSNITAMFYTHLPAGAQVSQFSITIGGKAGLEKVASTLPLWCAVRSVMADAVAIKHWIAILDPLPKDWSDGAEDHRVFNVLHEFEKRRASS